MLIFALDSTALTASVAICDGGRLIGEYTVNNGNTHSETLLPMAEALFSQTGKTVGDIEVFACSAGPGSFTGVRIGAATVKGLAFGRNKTCIGVSTLHALAYNIRGADGIICPVMNARRGQVYNALFDGNGERLCGDRALSVDELCREIEKKYENKHIYLCGDGTEITLELSGNREYFVPPPERLGYQSAYSVAQCALAEYEKGVRTTDAELTPVYLRMPQAEREKLEKSGNGIV